MHNSEISKRLGEFGIVKVIKVEGIKAHFYPNSMDMIEVVKQWLKIDENITLNISWLI